jgi:hypothetical protein
MNISLVMAPSSKASNAHVRTGPADIVLPKLGSRPIVQIKRSDVIVFRLLDEADDQGGPGQRKTSWRSWSKLF